MELYFAFGSNMSSQRMIDRNIKFTERKLSYLEGYQLVFNKQSYYENQGYANIIPKNNQIVYGILYYCEPGSLDTLDSFEGTPTHYQRHQIEITTGQSKVIATVYIACDNQCNNSLKPNKQYLNYLLGGEDLLPNSYFNMLKSIETV